MKEYQLDCPYAMDRLVKYGVPATVLHRQVDERDQIGRARQAAETVSSIIFAHDETMLNANTSRRDRTIQGLLLKEPCGALRSFF